MRKVEILHTGNPPDIGYFHQFNMNGGAVIELIDGMVHIFPSSYIQFLDSPEDEQRAEFAKAAMSGLLASQKECMYCDKIEGIRPYYSFNEEILARSSMRVADALILELKKQKP